ncbi:MAG: DUF3137 domain-containing protein [Clostridia bacterium]|nr:DUF3137 domain-containing protein [Clostridia bacterium]
MNMDQEFESIYQKIYDSSYSRLAEVKDKNRKFLLIFGLALLVINLFIYIIPATKLFSVLFICMSVCLLIFFIILGNQAYTSAYKKCVIEGLVKSYNPSIHFDPAIGISEMEYRASGFDNDFNEYNSEDRIYGRFDNGDSFQLAEVTTYRITRRVNDEGVEMEDRVETYRGMYGVVYLNKSSMFKAGIYGDSIMRRYRQDRIEMDSSEFEKYYDLVTDDKIRAMRIFTADLMEKYLDIRRNHKHGVELIIDWDKVYFRFRCGEIFEPPKFMKALTREVLRGFYNQIYYPLELLDKTVESINEIH